MRINKMKLLYETLSIVTLLIYIGHVNAEQSQDRTFTGKVVNTEGRSILGVKVSFYQVSYDNAAHTVESKLSGEVRTTSDGVFSFKAVVESEGYRSGYIVAEKEGFALGWADWEMRDSEQRDIILGAPKELSGVVVDEAGKPVPEARVGVWLIAVGEEQEQQRLGRPLAEKLLAAAADASGRFTFTNIPAEATADFIIRKAGKATLRTYRSTGYANQKCTFAPGRADIKLILSDEAKIRGTVVVVETGHPMAGVNLMVTDQGNRPLFGQEPVITKDDGTFSIDALGAGGYLVQLVRSQGKPADWVAEPIRVTLEAGQTEKDVKIELRKGGLLEIFVTEAETNKPLDKASVSLRDEKYQRWLSTQSGKDGVAQIRLAPRGYQLSGIYKQGYVSDREQEAVTISEGVTKRIRRQLDEIPKIIGIVRDPAGTPVEGVQLKMMPGGREEVQSDSEGHFEILWNKSRRIGREDTVFCLVARHEQRNLAKALEISDEKKILDLTLQPGVIFTGKIADPNDKGISGARIRVLLRLSNWGSPLTREQEKADDNGDYEIRAIPTVHNYNINASAEGYGEKNINVHTDNASDNRLNIETITLPSATLSVSGHIVDTEGHPVPDARISGSGEDQPRPHTLSDKQGSFTLDGLCEGTVYIRVDVSRGGKRLSARVHTDAGARGIRIVAREGRAALYYIAGKTDEEIIQGNERAIAGVALDEKGAPVTGVPVSVCCHQTKQEDGRSSWHYRTFIGLSDITDEQGRFAIAIQEEGKYNLRFSPDNHAAMIVYDISVGTKDLKVTLPEGGTVAGRLVRLEKGQKIPIPNVEVKIEQTDRASYTHLGFERDRTTITDEKGRFRFEHVRTKIRPRGNRTAAQWEYTARVWKMSYGTTSETIAFYEGNTIDGVELIVKPDPGSAPPLVGAAAPGFEGIKVDLPEDRIKGKIMLICFFDMNQRPSRHCIRQLSQKEKDLKAKNVVTVAVQAAEIDEQTLNAWVQKFDTSISVGVIQTNLDEIKVKWGVRAFPWLILTDSKHIVRAEGFAISELDQTLRQIIHGQEKKP